MRLSTLSGLVIRWGLGLGADLVGCLRFFTRLPLPAGSYEPAFRPERFGQVLRLAPVAGLAVGGMAALVLDVGADILGLPHVIAVTLAVGMEILISGGLHEDGLADVADGFGGGPDRRRKLDIMRDSRIGTYGALALILSAALRIAALAALLDRYGLGVATAVLPAAAAASRGFCLIPLALLRPARTEGLTHAAGMLPPGTLATAMAAAVFLGMILAFAGGVSEGRAMTACGASLAAGLAMTLLADRQIGGQTGDVAGAAQQGAEIAYLLALLVAPGLG